MATIKIHPDDKVIFRALTEAIGVKFNILFDRSGPDFPVDMGQPANRVWIARDSERAENYASWAATVEQENGHPFIKVNVAATAEKIDWLLQALSGSSRSAANPAFYAGQVSKAAEVGAG